MPYAATAAITELWAQAVGAFGRKLGISAASTTVDVQLKNNAGTVLSTGTIPAATQSAAGLMTAADKFTLDSLSSSGAEPNQDAWSYFKAGSTTVSAASETDTFEFVAGGNVSLAADAANKRLTISATDTTYDVFDGTEDGLVGYDSSIVETDKAIYIGDGTWRYMGTANEVSQSNPTTSRKISIGYIGDNAAFTELTSFTIGGAQQSVPGLMSSTDKAKLDGLSSAPCVYHATCSTAAGTSAKVATLDNAEGFSLAAGVVVAVTFQYGNSASSPKLNVNSTGLYGVAIASGVSTFSEGNGTTYNTWGAYETLLFTYNGNGLWTHVPSGLLGYLAYSGLSSKADTASPALTGTPTAPTAVAGTSTTQIATTAFVQQEIAAAQSGATVFKGVVNSNATISGSSYKAGWYWVVGTAGTYVGQTCEVGDMVFAVADKGASYSASDFSVVQNNIVEMTAAEVDAICTLS